MSQEPDCASWVDCVKDFSKHLHHDGRSLKGIKEMNDMLRSAFLKTEFCLWSGEWVTINVQRNIKGYCNSLGEC
jgi:hypothetical protein